MSVGSYENEVRSQGIAAQAVLAELRMKAIKIEIQGDRLRYSPRSAMTDKLLAALIECKSELLTLLVRACETSGGKCEGQQSNRQCQRCTEMLVHIPAYACKECMAQRWWRPRYGGGWQCGECRLADANSIWFCEYSRK